MVWFRFNNSGLALGTNLKFYISVAKGLKLKVRKFWGVVPTFVKITEGKLVGGAFLGPPPILNRVKGIISKKCINYNVYKFTGSCCNATFYWKSEKHFFVRASEHLCMKPLIRKRVKNPKMPAMFDHILLKGHKANFEDFTIPLKQNNEFRRQLKESLLIKRDKQELIRNIIRTY